MRKLVTAVLAAGAFALAAPALGADPPAADPSPIGGEGAHTHHVFTGDGGCVDIDAVAFEPTTSGLHQGSNASGGEELGPFHLPCP